MHRKVYFKLILVLAAILFVAKPFIGFVMHGRLNDVGEHPTILVKSFTKYRLDSLNDTEFCKDVSGDLFPSPMLPLLLSIGALLSSMFSRFNTGTSINLRNVFSKKPFVTSQPVYLTTLHLSI